MNPAPAGSAPAGSAPAAPAAPATLAKPELKRTREGFGHGLVELGKSAPTCSSSWGIFPDPPT